MGDVYYRIQLIARIWSIPAIAVTILAFFVPEIGPGEGVLLRYAAIPRLCGLIMAWRWELAGGATILITAYRFMTLGRISYIDLIWVIPAILFVICGFLRDWGMLRALLTGKSDS